MVFWLGFRCRLVRLQVPGLDLVPDHPAGVDVRLDHGVYVHRCHHGGGWVSGEPGEVAGVLDGPAHIVGVGGEGGLDGEVPGPAVVPIGGYDDYVGVLKAPDLPWLEPRGVTRFHQVAEVVLVEYLLLPATVRAMRRVERRAPFLAWAPRMGAMSLRSPATLAVSSVWPSFSWATSFLIPS